MRRPRGSYSPTGFKSRHPLERKGSMKENDFFHLDDVKCGDDWEGQPMSKGWWSRHYEYPWAISYAAANADFFRMKGQAADMGCGYTRRPFKDVLAKYHSQVIAVDSNLALLDLAFPKNVTPHVADMAETKIRDDLFDQIFCISVLEHSRNIPAILAEFERVLKPAGDLILTFDVPFDPSKPLGRWKGIRLEEIMHHIDGSNFTHGPLFTDAENALVHEEWNLCVYHLALKKP